MSDAACARKMVPACQAARSCGAAGRGELWSGNAGGRGGAFQEGDKVSVAAQYSTGSTISHAELWWGGYTYVMPAGQADPFFSIVENSIAILGCNANHASM